MRGSLNKSLNQWKIENIKIVGAILDLPANQDSQSGLNWVDFGRIVCAN